MKFIALLIAAIGLGLGGFGLAEGVAAGDNRPLLGWMIGLVFWLSILVGMLFLTMIWYLFDAGWPVIIRRQFEHALAGFKYIMLLFLPLLAVAWGFWGNDPGLLHAWLNPAKEVLGGHGTVGEDVLYLHKSGYLNLEWFTIRFFVFFGIWIGLAAIMRKSSYQMDKDGKESWAHVARKTSTVGLFVCALGSTFFAFDWFMSLEYHWFSTMYGVWFFAESMRSALAFTAILLLILASRKGYLHGLINQAHRYYVGCLMLAFTIFWAYISFSQYFLIYSANIPEETFWYHMRELAADGVTRHSWWWVSMALIFGQFFLPFFCLLSYTTKTTRFLYVVAGWMLVMHLIDIYWNILPGKMADDGTSKYGYIVRPFEIHWVDIATLVGTGALLTFVFIVNANRQKAIPVRDPRILESVHAYE